MNKFFITIHDKDEDILGHVGTENNTVDYPEFFDLVYESWKKYSKETENNDVDDFEDIEDFVEWHNETNSIQIFSFISNFIQL